MAFSARHPRVIVVAGLLVLSLAHLDVARPDPALSSASAASTAPSALAPDERPNILLITTDDQNESDMRYLPLTRQLLGQSGVTFRNMLSPHPLCCPARAEILTGQYAQNNGVRSNLAGLLGGHLRLDSSSTLATWLHDAGYRTVFVGKYLNGYHGQGQDRPPGWDGWNPVVQRVYSYYGFTMHENGKPRTYEDVNFSDLVGSKTRGYIRQLSARDEPFFLWASHVAPHAACGETCARSPVPAKRHRKLFPRATSPVLRDRAFNEDNVSDKPPFIANLQKVSEARVNRVFRARIRSLQAVDQAVASAVGELKKAGELERTLILFTSDNGLLTGEHRFRSKNVPYEPALEVPLLMRGPGLPKGVKRTQPVTMVDLAPTILDAAAVQPGLTVDGRSILPLAEDPTVRGYDTVLIQAGPYNESQVDDGWAFRGVRTSRYTYAQYYDPAFIELYDRQSDPAQVHNLANRPSYRQVREELAERTTLLGECSGVDCRRQFGPVP